ncbi:unnamed protein product [Clavelina lepadiformis]|uniref:C-type lectin domain-containing protein n=1 Tax=Clavelina lepadiformis TaxID=159417 RepID=A0ABP0EW47_CLALP
MKYGAIELGVFVCFVFSLFNFSASLIIVSYHDDPFIGQWREVKSGSGYYYILTNKKSFQHARDECRRYGGDLAVRVRDFSIRSTLQQTFNFDNAWIGLMKEDNNWVWVDKTSSTTGNTHWIQNPLQPSNSGGHENCGEIIDDYSLRTNDAPCTVYRHGLCEHNRQGYVAGNGYRYMLTSKGTWTNTRTECINEGGDLAAVGMKDFSLRACWTNLVKFLENIFKWKWNTLLLR